MSHTPTLMDYSRFNYVAQPEDNIPVEDSDSRRLVPTTSGRRCGVTNRFPERELQTKRRRRSMHWAREQDSKPWLRFSTADSRGSDPGENTEAVGDADAIVSTGLGIKNLKRVADMLLPATSQPGEPYEDLEELYGRMLGSVGHRAESRYRDCRWFQFAAETWRSGRSSIHDRSARTSGSSGPFLERQRVCHADMGVEA